VELAVGDSEVTLSQLVGKGLITGPRGPHNERNDQLMNKKQQDRDDESRMLKLHMRVIRRLLKKNPNARGILLPGLRAARIAEGLSQRDLAKMIGASQRTICELENQTRGAYPKTIRRLSKALKLEPLHLTFHPETVAAACQADGLSSSGKPASSSSAQSS
jgi:DNA-binding XRE family transcriptional regulator